MTRPIDAEPLLEKYREWLAGIRHINPSDVEIAKRMVLQDIIYNLQYAPTIELQDDTLDATSLKEIDKIFTESTKANQGEWIKTVDGNGWNDWYVLKCPFCGATIEDKHYHSWEYNFCPHCGADVRGERSE